MITRPLTSAQKALEAKYKSLRDIIEERRNFESLPENNVPPYVNYPANDDFPDVSGYTLLHYASQSGNIGNVRYLLKKGVSLEQKPLFQKTGTAFEMALYAGHPEIAILLFEAGALCHEIVTAKVHSACQAWFKNKIAESLQESFPEYKQGNFKKIKNSRFFNSATLDPFVRLVELGELTLIKLADKNKYLNDKNALLNSAASNGHQDMVEYLLANGAELNPEKCQYLTTSLHAAVQYRQHEITRFLISQDAFVNRQNEIKQTPLMLAVVNDDMEMVTLLLASHADILLQDCFCNSVLHYAVSASTAILKLLLNDRNCDKLFSCVNIHDRTPVDKAITAGADEVLALLCGKEKLQEIKKSPHYDKMIPFVNHGKLLPIIHYFLKLNYRDTQFLEIEGHCNGFSFMRNFYSARKMKFYFKDTLKRISNWDGNPLTLHEKFPENALQSRYHENLQSLLEQWTQDFIIFQGATTTQVIPFRQNEFDRKFALTCPSSEKDNSIIFVYRQENIFITIDQLKEMLLLIRKMPVGMQFVFTGAEHAVSGDVEHQGIDYYDPNFLIDVNPESSAASVATMVIDVKYRAANKITTLDKAFYKNKVIKKNDFTLFRKAETIPDIPRETKKNKKIDVMFFACDIYYFRHQANEMLMDNFVLFEGN